MQEYLPGYSDADIRNTQEEGKSMFCSKCGQEIKEGVRFCPRCGNQINGGNGQNQVMQTAVKKRPPYLAIGVIAIAVVICALLVKGIFFSNTYKTPIKNMVKALENQDVQAIVDILPPKLLEAAEEKSGMDIDMLLTYLEDGVLDEFTDENGDIHITYEITGVNDMTEEETQETEEYFQGYLGVIKEGKRLTFSYEVKEGDRQKDEGEEEIEVIKIDGKWYINPENFL